MAKKKTSKCKSHRVKNHRIRRLHKPEKHGYPSGTKRCKNVKERGGQSKYSVSGTRVKPRPNSRYRERARTIKCKPGKTKCWRKGAFTIGKARDPYRDSKSRRKSNRKSKQTQRYTPRRRARNSAGKKRKSRRSKRERDKVGRIIGGLASKKRIIAPQSCCGQKCPVCLTVIGKHEAASADEQEHNIAVLLQCRHCMCRSCFNQIMAQPSASARKCPTCRRAINPAAVTQAMCFSSGGVTSTIVISDDEN